MSCPWLEKQELWHYGNPSNVTHSNKNGSFFYSMHTRLHAPDVRGHKVSAGTDGARGDEKKGAVRGYPLRALRARTRYEL